MNELKKEFTNETNPLDQSEKLYFDFKEWFKTTDYLEETPLTMVEFLHTKDDEF